MSSVVPARPKLSTAILAGAKRHPQAFDLMFDPITGGTCVLGAAVDGAIPVMATSFSVQGGYTQLTMLYPELTEVHVERCPVCGLPEGWEIASPPLAAWLSHLNDVHRWKRERIAQRLQEMGF